MRLALLSLCFLIATGPLDHPGNLSGVNLCPICFGGGIGAVLLDDVMVGEISAETTGCTDEMACNFDPEAVVDDGSCWTPADYGWCDCEGNQLDALGECGGTCAADVDEDGVCDDTDECIGPDLLPEVLPILPSSYIAEVTLDGAPVVGMTVLAVVDGVTVGVDEAFEFEGGSWVSMSLYVLSGDEVEFFLFDEVTCTVYDDDLGISVSEAGGDLSTFFNPDSLPFTGAVIPGCTDEVACNFDPDAAFDNGGCEYPLDLYGVDHVDCNGDCLNDMDGDGVCDEAEVPGCLDDLACNYNPAATEADASCEYPLDLHGLDHVDCSGDCLNDMDGDGVCDEAEVPGCVDDLACNYNPAATEADASCEYPLDLYGVDYVDCAGDCLQDADGDGVCDEAEVLGCTDPAACNYDEAATEDDASCAFLFAETITGNVSVTVGDSPLYTASPSDPANTCTWAVSGGSIVSGQGTPIVTVYWTTEGVHAVQVVETNPVCDGDSLELEVTVSPVISVEEQAWLTWTPVPNPASGWIRVEGLPTGAGIALRLHHMDGRLIAEWPSVAPGEQLSLDGIAPGWYALEALWGDRRSVRPLLRE